MYQAKPSNFLKLSHVGYLLMSRGLENELHFGFSRILVTHSPSL
jgi:hypothetical protein